MLKALSITTCLGLAALLVQVVQVEAQGPIREGVRRTGEAVADGTRAAARGTREAIGRAGEATRNVVRGTTDAARAQVNRADRSELQANTAAAEAQAYDPAYDGRYQSGFRGVDDQDMNPQAGAQRASQVEYNGRLYNIRQDSRGRDFICVRGCPVYLNDLGNAQAHQAYKLSDDQMPHGQSHHDQAYQGDTQNQRDFQEQNTYDTQSGYDQAPAPPVPARIDAPAAPGLDADTANSANDEAAETNAEQDSNADQDDDANADDGNSQE